MSDQPPQTPDPERPETEAGGGPEGAPGEEQLTPEQEQMLRQMEEEVRRVRVQDVITQSAASILNLSARRIAKEDERDLEQARAGIEAVRALVGHLEDEPQREVRNALSQLQMLYAQHAGGKPPGEGGEPGPGGGDRPAGDRPGASKLWTPGSG